MVNVLKSFLTIFPNTIFYRNFAFLSKLSIQKDFATLLNNLFSFHSHIKARLATPHPVCNGYWIIRLAAVPQWWSGVLPAQEKRAPLECLRRLVLFGLPVRGRYPSNCRGCTILLLLPEPPKGGKEGVSLVHITYMSVLSVLKHEWHLSTWPFCSMNQNERSLLPLYQSIAHHLTTDITS